MGRKTIVSLTLALFCSSVLVLGSCAQKRIRVEEGKVVEGSPKEKKPTEPGGVDMGATEDEKREEAAERQARAFEQERARERERVRERERAREAERTQAIEAEIRAFESEPIYFDFDKSNLKPPARATLEKKADWLRANPEFSLLIEGHCDEQGTYEYNLVLGERRATAAAKFLRDLGVSAERISTISYGEERPAVPGKSEEAWAKNRRDEFRIIKK